MYIWSGLGQKCPSSFPGFILQPWRQDVETALRNNLEWPGNEARMNDKQYISHVLGLILTKLQLWKLV